MRELTEKEIVQRHAYYYEILQEMGKMGISGKPSMGNMKIPRGIVQQAYKEMNEKRNQFMGSIIDYLEWISANFFLWIIKKQITELGYANKLMSGDRVSFEPGPFDNKPTVPLDGLHRSLVLDQTIKNEALVFRADFDNMVRLYNKNRQYITDLLKRSNDEVVEWICQNIESSARFFGEGHIEASDVHLKN